MRTTLTIDDDVAASLKQLSRQSGQPFKVVVNDILRLGLATKQRPPSIDRFRVRARDLGLRPGFSYDNVGELLEELDRNP